MGTWAAWHAWHVCVSPAPSVCHVYGRKEQGETHTHTHIHTCSPSHGNGGVTIAFTAAALRVAQPDEFFRVPAHTYHTRAGSITLTWQVRAHVPPALRGSTSLIQVRG